MAPIFQKPANQEQRPRVKEIKNIKYTTLRVMNKVENEQPQKGSTKPPDEKLQEPNQTHVISHNDGPHNPQVLHRYPTKAKMKNHIIPDEEVNTTTTQAFAGAVLN